MNDQIFLQNQALELRRLLEGAASDPILAPQLRERIADVEKELQEAICQHGSLLPKEALDVPRAAIFLRGGGVEDSEGIRPALAGKALMQYEEMFIQQALYDEREAARKAGRQRRPRGASTPGLLFTGTPRGSFGLEFVPQSTDDSSLMDVHAQSLHHVADALILVAESDVSEFDETINKIPPRVLEPLKKFMTTLALYDAELRLAFPRQPSRTLTIEKVKNTAERLEKEVNQETVKISGTFRGVTRESGYFDLKTDEGNVITGTVADHLTEDDLERIDRLTNTSCVAELQKTTVSKITGVVTPKYVLINATESTGKIQ